jgi:hypothetical protein
MCGTDVCELAVRQPALSSALTSTRASSLCLTPACSMGQQICCRKPFWLARLLSVWPLHPPARLCDEEGQLPPPEQQLHLSAMHQLHLLLQGTAYLQAGQQAGITQAPPGPSSCALSVSKWLTVAAERMPTGR